MIRITCPGFGASVTTHPDVYRLFFEQEKFLYELRKDQFPRWNIMTENDENDLTRPVPIHIEWEDDNKSTHYVLKYSENPDMSDHSAVFCKGRSYDLYNLKIATEYFITVQNGEEISEIHKFITKNETPRCIRCDGAQNIRDIGGYAIPGGVIRQGCIFRGGNTDTGPALTAEGAKVFADFFRTEIDLRLEKLELDYKFHGLTSIAGVNHLILPLLPYGDIFAHNLKDSTKECFEVLFDPSYYPVYFHCHAGADRTGTVAFILEAILGVSEHDLRTDYEFTSFTGAFRSYTDAENMNTLYKNFAILGGDTIHEQCERFLTDYLGIDRKKIDDFREYMSIKTN